MSILLLLRNIPPQNTKHSPCKATARYAPPATCSPPWLTLSHSVCLQCNKKLTGEEENDRPPILPPDLAARASPGPAKVTAAIVAATANFLARSVVKASHAPLLLPSPPPAAAMRSDEDRGCTARARVAVVPVKCAEGTGTKADAGLQVAAKQKRDIVLMLRVALFCNQKVVSVFGGASGAIFSRVEGLLGGCVSQFCC